MITEYSIFDISGVDPIGLEQMGTKSKFWYKNDEGELYLFKATLSKDKWGNDIQRDGEDWAEKIACEIAKALQIPCALYELASYNGQQGIITKNFVADGENMQYGNSLLKRLYKILGKTTINPNHTHQLSDIVFCLYEYIKNPPTNWDQLPEINTACDVFSGYLMFDALISNQDRHNENWGMISNRNNQSFLAPTFDHAASLGRNESDEKRQLKLTSNDKGQSVSHYVSKAKSQILSLDLKRLKTIEAFSTLGQTFAPKASINWLQRLAAIDKTVFEDIINRVPSTIMTDISKQFALQIIIANKHRLLALLPTFKNRIQTKS